LPRWNGTTWAPLGTGIQGTVYALQELANGDLIAAGLIFSAGGITTTGIARWDGAAWHALGGGLGVTYPCYALALAILPNGDLVLAAKFTVAGGVFADNIAKWDGASWSSLGAGVDEAVTALAVLPNGDLIVGGGFVRAGSVYAHGLARWDGTSWSSLGTNLFAMSVGALAVLANGDVVAGGAIGGSAGGIAVHNIARWDGTNWSALGIGVNDYVFALRVLPDGDLVVGGDFTTAGGAPIARVARWGRRRLVRHRRRHQRFGSRHRCRHQWRSRARR
jgi:hypothetical protein